MLGFERVVLNDHNEFYLSVMFVVVTNHDREAAGG